ncbi:NAD(P)H-dependent oxidoreductase [Vibrio sp. JC009]|uniref:NAD(P)H-dependent oxidoreductase n=1 Tax=Vibrio sp. JC009 TaxID=2912314 RepID=UPI0023B1253D|nr:NAD(P)H-dependent oxidoreductase [Vibrio sp. JC009]WED23434.1 NAD(P)H-dependent oxidoreductase [Vibrio sp. JC009]
MSKVLVISGHPNLAESYTNRVILDELNTQLSDVSVRRLDSLYADSKIDVAAEQKALTEAEVIVLQFPFYWYSVPGLMKTWIDEVMTFNFAFGPEGDKLKGKDFILSFTVGGPQESYQPLGYNHFNIEMFMYPLQQMAYLASMNYHAPVYTHSMVYIPGVYNTQEEVEERARNHAERLVDQIAVITESADSRIRKFVAEWFSKFDRMAPESSYFTSHLAQDVRWVMPDAEFNGHEGFRDWYAIALRTFKPGCQHLVDQVQITESEEGYDVELRIRVLAETFEDSIFKGEEANFLANETWKLTLDDKGQITISDYRVAVVD